MSNAKLLAHGPALSLCLALLWPLSVFGQSDIATRMAAALPAGSEVLDSSQTSVVDYDYLVSAAEKVGRDLRFDRALTVSGERSRTVWQLPDGAQLDTVFELASAQLSGEELFSCAGRNCGRSTAWANLVYSQVLVIGQDRYQRYRVVRSSPTELASLYVIRRGNQRIHLLLETLSATESTVDPDFSPIRSELARVGFTRLRPAPDMDGVLDGAALEMLVRAGRELAGLHSGSLYVVCHMYGARPADELIEQSRACAETARARLQAGYSEVQERGPVAEQKNRPRPPSTTFIGFGAGPLLPRLHDEDPLGNRIELIVPAQLRLP